MKPQKNENDLWIKICVLPLVIGFSLVIANITMFIFKVIGWFLLILGIITGAFYIFKLYKAHREKILETLRKLRLLKSKEYRKGGGK